MAHVGFQMVKFGEWVALAKSNRYYQIGFGHPDFRAAGVVTHLEVGYDEIFVQTKPEDATAWPHDFHVIPNERCSCGFTAGPELQYQFGFLPTFDANGDLVASYDAYDADRHGPNGGADAAETAANFARYRHAWYAWVGSGPYFAFTMEVVNDHKGRSSDELLVGTMRESEFVGPGAQRYGTYAGPFTTVEEAVRASLAWERLENDLASDVARLEALGYGWRASGRYQAGYVPYALLSHDERIVCFAHIDAEHIVKGYRKTAVGPSGEREHAIWQKAFDERCAYLRAQPAPVKIA